MLQLFFEGISSTSSFRTDPSDAYRIEGGCIRDSRGEPIAIRHNESWKARGNFYTHIECVGPVSIAFQNPTDGTSEVVGPLQRVTIISGTLQGDGEFLGLLGRHGEWRHTRTQKKWPAVIITQS